MRLTNEQISVNGGDEMDREKVIKELHDARRYLEDKEWSDRGASPHIDAINDALALLKEQEKDRLEIAHEMVSGSILMYRGKELVRCKDCKHFQSGMDINGRPFTRCNGKDENNIIFKTYGNTEPDWFCADGERSDGTVAKIATTTMNK